MNDIYQKRRGGSYITDIYCMYTVCCLPVVYCNESIRQKEDTTFLQDDPSQVETIYCDTLWHSVTLCDSLWHVVTRCDTLWQNTDLGNTPIFWWLGMVIQLNWTFHSQLASIWNHYSTSTFLKKPTYSKWSLKFIMIFPSVQLSVFRNVPLRIFSPSPLTKN